MQLKQFYLTAKVVDSSLVKMPLQFNAGSAKLC